ncbi:MAG: AAA family ATPase [Pirellulales bacterium]|nr:AAA family ATPase [Pirellulales bacterium]
MSTKDDTSLDHPSNGQSLVVHHSTPLGTKDADWAAVPSYGQGHDHSQMNAAVYFHAVRRHWFLGLLLGVILAVAAGVATWFLLPIKYTATSLIQVSMEQPKLLKGDPRFNLQREYEIYKDTQSQLVRSPLVLMAALRKPEIASLSIYKREEVDPITWLQDELRVFFGGEGQIMSVSLTDDNKEEVAKVVRAVVDAYLSEIVESERSEKHRALADLEAVLAAKEQEIRQRRTTLRRLADELGTADRETLNMQMQFALQQLSMYRGQLAQVQIDLQNSKSEFAASRKALERLESAPANTLELERLKLQDPICRELQKKISDLQAVASQAAGKGLPGKPGSLSIQLVEQINTLQADLQARLDHLSTILTAAMRNELQEKVSDLEVRIALAQELKTNLDSEVSAKREEFEKIGKSSVELDMMRTELENLEDVTSGIAVQRETLEVETKSPPRIRLHQRAEEPISYDNPEMHVALTIIAAIAGLILPLVGIVWWDVRKERINSSEDVAKGLGLPVMGSVPVIPGRAIKRLNAPGKKNQVWNVRLAESVDGIAAKLLRNAAIEKNRVVLITSAVSGEGKTTLATQVAMSLARAGKQTVLVDFDLRRPAVDKAFQLPLYPGVSEALCGENDIKSLPQTTGLPNLEVVTAGRCDRHALQSLANGNDKQLFEELREKYEFVIVDGSPILPVADSRYVSQHVDSVVLSVFRDYSRVPKVTAACEILEAFGVRDIEAVVTSSSEDGYGVIDMVAQKAPVPT